MWVCVHVCVKEQGDQFVTVRFSFFFFFPFFSLSLLHSPQFWELGARRTAGRARHPALLQGAARGISSGHHLQHPDPHLAAAAGQGDRGGSEERGVLGALGGESCPPPQHQESRQEEGEAVVVVVRAGGAGVRGRLMEFGAEETLVALPGRFTALCGKQELTVRPTE